MEEALHALQASSTSTSTSTSQPSLLNNNNTISSVNGVGHGGGSYMDALKMNPYFSAGFGLAGMGVALQMLKRGVGGALFIAQKRLLVTMEIPSKDPSYHWVLQWISQNARSTQHLGVETSFRQLSNGQPVTVFNYVPSPGKHFIRYNGMFVQVERTREKTMVDLNSGLPFETVTLTTLGRNREIFTPLLRQAKALAMEAEEGKTIIMTSMGPEWRPFGQPRRRRPMHSVVLDNGLAESILADIQEFLNCSQWYIDRGIPYRRGYLLYGPPGCGKSSFITSLAGELGYGICILNINERGLTDDRLNHLLSHVPPRSIVLLEDVDAAFNQREASSDVYAPSVTFSGLLNTLDGVAAGEERIVFMTTNHIDRLDPALIRPGRVDMKVHIGPASDAQLEKMFLRFYPENVDLAKSFVSNTRNQQDVCTRDDHKMEGYSIARVQGYFMRFKNDAKSAATASGL